MYTMPSPSIVAALLWGSSHHRFDQVPQLPCGEIVSFNVTSQSGTAIDYRGRNAPVESRPVRPVRMVRLEIYLP